MSNPGGKEVLPAFDVLLSANNDYQVITLCWNLEGESRTCTTEVAAAQLALPSVIHYAIVHLVDWQFRRKMKIVVTETPTDIQDLNLSLLPDVRPHCGQGNKQMLTCSAE